VIVDALESFLSTRMVSAQDSATLKALVREVFPTGVRLLATECHDDLKNSWTGVLNDALVDQLRAVRLDPTDTFIAKVSHRRSKMQLLPCRFGYDPFGTRCNGMNLLECLSLCLSLYQVRRASVLTRRSYTAWNSLPVNIRAETSQVKFKKLLKLIFYSRFFRLTACFIFVIRRLRYFMSCNALAFFQ